MHLRCVYACIVHTVYTLRFISFWQMVIIMEFDFRLFTDNDKKAAHVGTISISQGHISIKNQYKVNHNSTTKINHFHCAIIQIDGNTL